MRRLTLALVALIMAPASVTAEPQRIDDDPAEQPCDNLEATDMPPCETDSGKKKDPALPNDPVIVPPDIPAEGLPNQDKAPTSNNNPVAPKTR